MKRELVNPVRDLLDAAVRHQTIRLRCLLCPRVSHYDPHAMWWLFERKAWADWIRDVPHHFYCPDCRKRNGAKVRPKIETLDGMVPVDRFLAMPSDRDWKNALSRRR